MNVQRGFTLVEVVLVVVILGILATIALPRFSGFREQGEESVANAAVAAVAAAASQCYSMRRARCTFAEITGSTYLKLQDATVGGNCSSVTATSGAATSTVPLDISEFCDG